MTIDEFLLARIAEDEAYWGNPAMLPFTGPGTSRLALKVQAECAAKRVIVELATKQLVEVEGYAIDGGMDLDPPHVSDDILRVLAAVYAEHPDFDPAWAL